jgi:uncharacterized paraquat-inducible protein A
MAEFTKAVKGAVKVTCSKAKKVADVAILKVSLRSKEVDLDECFEKLGRAYYFGLNEKIENTEKLNMLVSQADKLCEDIFDLKQQIAEAKNSQVCTHCASIYKKDEEFCPYCTEHKVVASTKPKKEDDPQIEE